VPAGITAMLIAHGVSARDAAWLLGVDGPAVGVFAYLGAKHMVTGYDHLLFLAGVIFFCTACAMSPSTSASSPLATALRCSPACSATSAPMRTL
jgi:hypothetical protein